MKTPILVSTDLCCRGINIKNIDLVINYNCPYDLDTFIYRAGRTARISAGTCMTFVDPRYDYEVIKQVVEVSFNFALFSYMFHFSDFLYFQETMS